MSEQRITTKVAISLGNKADLAIIDDQLFITQQETNGAYKAVIPLGRATKDRIKALQHYLDRLAVHAVDS